MYRIKYIIVFKTAGLLKNYQLTGFADLLSFSICVFWAAGGDAVAAATGSGDNDDFFHGLAAGIGASM